MRYLKFIVFISFLTFTISCGQQKRYAEYKVKEGETIRTIARDYDMSTRDLLRLNPDVDRRPEPNTVIIVPKKKKTEDTINIDGKTINDISKDLDTVSINSESIDIDIVKKFYVVHKVIKGDTFYSLTRFYNVSEEQLKELNPQLSEGLKVDAYIKIKKIEDEDDKEDLIYTDYIDEDVSLKVAMLLPFKTAELDSLSSSEIFDKNMLANIVTDFYLGAEIAADSLRKQGIKIELNVFDTGDRETKIKSILANKDLNKNDAIIGPIYSEEAIIVANKVKAPVIFPVFSSKQHQFSSSKLIKTQPESEVYKTEMISFILHNYAGENIVIVSDNANKSSLTVSQLKKHDSVHDISIVIPEKGYIKKESLINVLKPDINNWIIIDTKENVLAANTVNSLISLPTIYSLNKDRSKGKRVKMQALSEETGVRIFTFEKGKTFDKIDNNKLAKLGFTFASDIFSNEESFAVKSFNANYKEKNNTFPSYYATKGFDITYDVLMRLASGESLKNTFNDGVSYRLESKFDYSKKLFSASDNNGVFIVQYNPDLTLVRLK